MKSLAGIHAVLCERVRYPSQNFCLTAYRWYYFARFMNHGKLYA
ncbi:hypothetical protein D083_3409 [Dickeya solani RNS 08.23.3.1.A]|nr:hypothetical protein D083_3409 [Dickeya solani RNS 08.23.3.1.A]